MGGDDVPEPVGDPEPIGDAELQERCERLVPFTVPGGGYAGGAVRHLVFARVAVAQQAGRGGARQQVAWSKDRDPRDELAEAEAAAGLMPYQEWVAAGRPAHEPAAPPAPAGVSDLEEDYRFLRRGGRNAADAAGRLQLGEEDAAAFEERFGEAG